MDEDGLGAERKAILARVAQESEERDRGTRRARNSPGGSTTDAQTVRTSRETARNPRPVGTLVSVRAGSLPPAGTDAVV